MSLHLIALSYDDVFEGPKKLCSLYDKLNADIVVSTTSQTHLNRIFSAVDDFLAHPSISQLKPLRQKELLDYLLDKSMYFPHHTNHHYAHKNGITHLLADPSYHLSEKSYHQFIIEIKSLIQDPSSCYYPSADDNRRTLTSARLAECWDYGCQNEHSFIFEALFFAQKLYDWASWQSPIPLRELEQQIRFNYNPQQRVVVPLEMKQCFNSRLRLTLYSRLQDLNPTRELLM